jgi:hypothetical protein
LRGPDGRAFRRVQILFDAGTRKIGGTTVTRRLTAEQLDAWQPLIDNARCSRRSKPNVKT